MCFSAGASFVTSGVLAGAGTAIVQKTKRFRAIAFIPLLFAIQQFIEGLQWIAPHPSELSIILGYTYLLFAFVLWPTYVPLSVLAAESDKKRRNILTGFFIAGALTSTALLFILLAEPLQILMTAHGINYQIAVPFINASAAWYALIITGSLLASSHRFIRYFSILVFTSAVLTMIFFFQAFTSIWCFFAAVLSLYIFFALLREGKK